MDKGLWSGGGGVDTMCGQGVLTEGEEDRECTPLSDMATDVAGMHPTGMHTCQTVFKQKFCQIIGWHPHGLIPLSVKY